MVCTNHNSHLDSVAIMAALGMPFSACALLAAEDYFFHSRMRLRALARALTLIPVRRRASAASFRLTIDRCRHFLGHGGRALIAYPEGSRGGGGIRSFKRGPAAIAIALGLPIVPGFVDGTDRILPKGRTLPRPGPIKVHFGRPLGFEPRAKGTDGRRSKALTAELEGRVRALQSAADAGVLQ
jgi:1-acyl-sn-glycerol-3-phosphate acyltransferase